MLGRVSLWSCMVHIALLLKMRLRAETPSVRFFLLAVHSVLIMIDDIIKLLFLFF